MTKEDLELYASMDPAALQQMLGLGVLDDQYAQAHEMSQPVGKDYGTVGGNIAGGLGDVLRQFGGGMRMRQIGDQQTAGRSAYADALRKFGASRLGQPGAPAAPASGTGGAAAAGITQAPPSPRNAMMTPARPPGPTAGPMPFIGPQLPPPGPAQASPWDDPSGMSHRFGAAGGVDPFAPKQAPGAPPMSDLLRQYFGG